MSSVHTYPPAELHTIMTSTTRARHVEPSTGGFLRSTMRHHEMDDVDEGKVIYDQRKKKVTQEEQDAEDEKARKRAMRNLINSWQERLQLISVITTFFATTEAAMLVNTKPGIGDFGNKMLRASNAGLLGSLILHVYASVLSFLGAFLLISYKVREAKREEMIVEGIKMVNSPREKSVIDDVERGVIDPGLPRSLTSNDVQFMMHKSINNGTAMSAPEKNDMPRDDVLYPAEPFIFAADPHIEQVGPLGSNDSSSRLLSRIHAICVFLTAAGFILAIIGILCYAWALLPVSVSIFTSACFGGALLCMVALLI